jgi:hypothetical protein
LTAVSAPAEYHSAKQSRRARPICVTGFWALDPGLMDSVAHLCSAWGRAECLDNHDY